MTSRPRRWSCHCRPRRRPPHSRMRLFLLLLLLLFLLSSSSSSSLPASFPNNRHLNDDHQRSRSRAEDVDKKEIDLRRDLHTDAFLDGPTRDLNITRFSTHPPPPPGEICIAYRMIKEKKKGKKKKGKEKKRTPRVGLCCLLR